MFLKLTIAKLLILSSAMVYANVEDIYERAQKKHDDFCKQMHGYQPGWPDILYALDILSIKAKRSSCNLRNKIGLTKKTHLYITGFRKLVNGNELSYRIVEFPEGKGAVTKDCIATSKIIKTETAWDEIYDNISCKTRQ